VSNILQSQVFWAVILCSRRTTWHLVKHVALTFKWWRILTSNTYEGCPESEDTKVLNLYNIFNLKSYTVNELPVH